MAFAHALDLELKPHPFSPMKTSSSDSGVARAVSAASSHPVPCHRESASDPATVQCRTELMSHWADGPEAHGLKSAGKHHPAHKAAPNSDSRESGFDQLTLGDHGKSISDSKAPSTLKLPKELTKGLQMAWNRSMPRGDSQEQGGLLAQRGNGSLAWLPGQGDDSGSFNQRYKDVGPGQTLLASAHTHPYSKGEGGYTNVPFSGRDLALHIYEQQRLNIVQSGQGLFGSARTQEFDELVKSRDERGRRALFREIDAYWENIKDKHIGSLPEKVDAATRGTSEHYHLLYYAGRQNKLDKVDLTSGAKHSAQTEPTELNVK